MLWTGGRQIRPPVLYSMKIHIMKFGGSSLGTPEKIKNVAERAAAKIRSGIMPVLVVSAPADITDDLIGLGKQVSSEMPSREHDALVSCGEQISAALCATAIAQIGFPARSFTGWQAGILTDSSFTDAKILAFPSEKLYTAIKSGIVPVLAGFQGAAVDGSITTLGRGGSDLTAVMAAKALNADLCEFYTDVKGIYNAHPGIVSDAEVLPLISYMEVIELGEKGTEVRQLRAIRYAMENKLRLCLRSSFLDGDADSAGTVITSEGRRGMNVLSIRKVSCNGNDVMKTEISMIGFRMDDNDFKKFEAVSLRNGAEKVFKEKDCLTALTTEKNGEALLKHIHSAILRGNSNKTLD